MDVLRLLGGRGAEAHEAGCDGLPQHVLALAHLIRVRFRVRVRRMKVIGGEAGAERTGKGAERERKGAKQGGRVKARAAEARRAEARVEARAIEAKVAGKGIQA